MAHEVGVVKGGSFFDGLVGGISIDKGAFGGDVCSVDSIVASKGVWYFSSVKQGP